MLLHTGPLFYIYFGNAEDLLFPQEYKQLSQEKNILEKEQFLKLKKFMQLEHLIFLDQIHGTSGMVVSKNKASTIRSFANKGDFLLTKAKHVGLGVMTADCLPIVLYDNVNNAIGIIHAGWKGSVSGIAIKAVKEMEETFSTKQQNLQIFFGPSAKVCCYNVGNEIIERVEQFAFARNVLQKRQEKVFFDLPQFNRLLLESTGVRREAIQLGYNLCTMCDEKFYSYRRHGKQAGRQMTIVSLK